MPDDFVCKSDFQEYKQQNASEHKIILSTLNKLAPLADEELIKTLKESAELANASRKIANRFKGTAKTAAVFLGLVSVVLLIIKQSRDLLIDFFIKLK